MVATMRHLLAALLLLTAVGSAEAQTWGSSTVETTAANLSASSNVFTPPCPTLGGLTSSVYNITVTAANQSIAMPGSCPNSSVGLFVTFNICNGKGGTTPCNGAVTGPFSPGLVFASGYEFPGNVPYAVSSGNANNVSGAKDLVTCEVMGTSGPWSCGTPQYTLRPATSVSRKGFADLGNANSTPLTVAYTVNSASNFLVVVVDGPFSAGDTVSTPTYNGVSMTLGAKQIGVSSVVRSEYIFYLLNPTHDGSAHNIAIAWSGGDVILAVAADYAGVNSLDGSGVAFGSSTPATSGSTPITTTAGDWVIASLGGNTLNSPSGSTLTQVVGGAQFSFPYIFDSNAPVAATGTFNNTFTFPNNAWAATAIAIH